MDYVLWYISPNPKDPQGVPNELERAKGRFAERIGVAASHIGVNQENMEDAKSAGLKVVVLPWVRKDYYAFYANNVDVQEG